jgi:hypothetical protein
VPEHGRPRRVVALAVAAGVVGTLVALPGVAVARAPLVEQMVVFRSGKALQESVRASSAGARVGRRRCGVAAATPLAALLRSRPGRVGIEDFGSCSRGTRDSGQLYVRSIRGDRERGAGGWVYKVGRRIGTAGAADPKGPFGRGRLRSGHRVTWFYCILRGGTCQRTLALRASQTLGGVVAVTVRSYDDEGRAAPAAGATVSGGGATSVTDAAGIARLTLPPGRHRLAAKKPGLIRTFGERVIVR